MWFVWVLLIPGKVDFSWEVYLSFSPHTFQFSQFVQKKHVFVFSLLIFYTWLCQAHLLSCSQGLSSVYRSRVIHLRWPWLTCSTAIQQFVTSEFMWPTLDKGCWIRFLIGWPCKSFIMWPAARSGKNQLMALVKAACTVGCTKKKIFSNLIIEFNTTFNKTCVWLQESGTSEWVTYLIIQFFAEFMTEQT